MKLVSLNVAIKMPNTERIIAFLKEQRADVIVLQEVVRHLEDDVRPEYRTHDDIKAALRSTHPYNFFGPIWLGDAFRFNGKVERHFGGMIEQGLDVFSRYPLTKGANEFYYKHYEYRFDWAGWHKEDHGRAVQIAQIDVDGKPLQILNVHGIWTADKLGDKRTLAQCEYLVQAAQRRDIPTIIAGDFNLSPDTPSIGILGKHFRNLVKENNIRSTRPEFEDELETGKNVVDYVFVSAAIKIQHFEVANTDISDHLPLVAEFEI